MLLIDDIPLFNWSRSSENIDSKFLRSYAIDRITFITRLAFQVLNIFVVSKVNEIGSFLSVDRLILLKKEQSRYILVK